MIHEQIMRRDFTLGIVKSNKNIRAHSEHSENSKVGFYTCLFEIF